MPDLSEPQATKLGRVFGPIPIVLSVLVVAAMAGLLVLAQVDRSQTQAAAEQISSSDSAVQVTGAAARDSLTMSQASRAWLEGLASRRDVQISRALLARRLNTTTRDGELAGDLLGPELKEPLSQFDQVLISAPGGLLQSADRAIWVPKMSSAILGVENAAKGMLSRQAGLSNDARIDATREDQDLAVWQLRLLAALLLLAGLLFIFLWKAIRANYRQAQQLLTADQAELDRSSLKLQRMKDFEQDESRLLQLIISGSQLEDVFTEIAAVASAHSQGRTYRVAIEGTESRSEAERDESEFAEQSWPFEISRWNKTGVVECFAPAQSANETETATANADLGNLEDIGRRCAELARIAVSDSWARRELIREATHDPLTGLLNRAYLEQQLVELLDVRNSGGSEVALVFCDLDRFKLVNDSLGHKAGDILLVNLAAWFSSAVDAFLQSPAGLSTEVVLSRFGGDEFVMVCTGGQPLEAALALGLRVSELSSRPIVLEGIETFTDMSIGIAVSTDQAKTAEQLVRNADVAMYRSKALGLGGPVLYSGEVEADRVEHIQTNTMLRRAFERDEFRLYLQPIIEFSTSRTVGFEGLVRWQHPTLGLLGPGQFLDNVQELGLVGQLDSWMRREAFGVMARLNTAAGEVAPYLSLNVTERELQNATFTAEVLDQIRTAGIPPEQVVLELSENAFVDFEGNEETLEELRAGGIRIALDDFGTGYSSLMQLQTLPIDIVKLDRAFVSALTSGGKRALGVLEGLLHVIGAVELILVVEGIETEFEQDVLVSLGCKFAQGYLYGRPAPAMDVVSLFSAGAASSSGDYASS